MEAPPLTLPHLRHQRGLVGGDGLLEVLLALGVLVGEPEEVEEVEEDVEEVEEVDEVEEEGE